MLCECSPEEKQRIQEVCIEKHHLWEGECLETLIAEDELALLSTGITFEQLSDFFEMIRVMFSYCMEKMMALEVLPEELRQYALAGKGWCCWGAHGFRMFRKRFTVTRVTWGGAEECPFKSENDRTYYGYKFGSHDWVFVDNDVVADATADATATATATATIPLLHKSMHIGDLLFHQIAKHHFFQSRRSKYRVDPVQLISFFQLKPNVCYRPVLQMRSKWNLEMHASDMYCKWMNAHTIALDEHLRYELVPSVEETEKDAAGASTTTTTTKPAELHIWYFKVTTRVVTIADAEAKLCVGMGYYKFHLSRPTGYLTEEEFLRLDQLIG